MKENYSKINVKKVTKADDFNYFIEIDENFCMNVNRNHTSSGVYFQIKRSGICQRCFCKKQTTDGRISGTCKEFSSKEIGISKQLETFLFGAIENSKGKNSKRKNIININIIESQDKLSNCKNFLSQLEKEILKN
jgi:hypothetical protein